MAKNFTVAGKLTIPLEEAAVPSQTSLDAAFPYVAQTCFSRKYDIAVVDDGVDLGTLESGGARATFIRCTAGACTIKFNGGADAWPLSANGGFFLWVNSAQGFLTTATITTSGAATVTFVAVG